MSQMNQSFETDKNIHLLNKENFSVIMDYSNENSISPKTSKNIFSSNKTLDKIQGNNNIKINNKDMKKSFFIEYKSSKSISRSNSFVKKERKIIPIIGIDSDKKDKKMEFNELPALNRTKTDIKKKRWMKRKKKKPKKTKT